MKRVWPLTGRAEELRFIDAAMRRSGMPKGVVLAGAPGVGKTRLAREALAGNQSRAGIQWAVATVSARGQPFGAFSTLMGSLGGDPTQMLRRAADVLLDVPHRAGVVVGVDDAHLLDELSASFVLQLVLDGAATVVVTLRSGEPAPDAVTALWKDGHLDRLEVQPLSEPETGRLLEAVLGEPVESTSVARLWSLTRGNVLFLRQLVDGELETRRLRLVRGVWRWQGVATMSPQLTELVEARVGHVSGLVAEVVDLLAVSEPLSSGLLARLVDPAAVEEAETAGLVTVEMDGMRTLVRLAHPLYGEVRRAALGRLRARRLRGRVATALAGTGGRRAEDTLRRAMLALDSDLEPDPRLFADAARSAMQLLDLSLAERLAGTAIAAGGGLDPQLTLAYALTWSNRGEEADAELSSLERVARTDAERGQVVIPRAGNLFWTLSRPADAEAVLDAVERAATTPAARCRLTAMHAAFHAFLGRPKDAVRCAREALASGDLGDADVVLGSWGLVLGNGLLGHADEVDPVAERGYAASTRTFDGAVLRYGLSHLHMVVLQLAGYIERVEAIAGIRRTEDAGAPGPMPLLGAALLGHASLASGRLGAAVRWLQEGRGSDVPGWEYCCLVSLTQAWAMAGDAVAARRTLAELETHRHPGFVFLDPEVGLARAWVAASEGAVSEAVGLALDAAAGAARQGQLAHEMHALQTVVRFGDGTVAGRLAELAECVDGPRAPAAYGHAIALAAGDGAALDEAAARWERIGDLGAAGDARAQAAAAYERRHQPELARAAAARAQRLAEACEGARTPALTQAFQPLPLTSREREIVALAADGFTNREIAARLVVSVRTVEGHVYRASAKLGATTRADFATLLHGGSGAPPARVE